MLHWPFEETCRHHLGVDPVIVLSRNETLYEEQYVSTPAPKE